MSRLGKTEIQSPDVGLLEIASIFAESLRRLRQQGRVQIGNPRDESVTNALNIHTQDLDQARKTRLSVTSGLTARRHND